ncbi:PREDICTED: V-type proton ATPase subunit E-like [Priapulus caudatus]|uniref:V-type proton ATPase subunit E-like n=1 Tax=Priapulus caudatus TaxID=37621 RepID=A0ABM1EGK4_PRICU|nr:PREDICTED: V-type proton ATPase subunit E-like [Priapulus caudatus]
MMAFIEQEANEKAEEIEAKAEEEFNIEKGRLVQQQRVKIMDFYEKKEKQVELQRKIQASNMLNQARLKVLKTREDHVKNIVDENVRRLGDVTKNQQKYAQILEGLIVQGLFQLLEHTVVIRCRQKDVALVESVFPSAVTQVKAATGTNVKLSIDKESYLPAEIAGGIELLANQGKIKVINTLEQRLQSTVEQMIPEIRAILFGVNPNRKHLD